MQIEGQKMLFCVPTRGHMEPYQWCDIANLMATTKQWWEAAGGQFGTISDGRGHITDSRTGFAEFAVEEGIQWLFWMDDDAKPQDPHLIKKLWASEKLWIAPLFFKRLPPHDHTIIRSWADREDHLSTMDNPYPPRLFKAQGCGFHAMLMHTNIYKRAREEARSHLNRMRNAVLGELPWGKHREAETFSPFQMLPPWSEDMTFCRFASMAGCQLWIDSRIEVPHVTWDLIDLKAHIRCQRSKARS